MYTHLVQHVQKTYLNANAVCDTRINWIEEKRNRRLPPVVKNTFVR